MPPASSSVSSVTMRSAFFELPAPMTTSERSRSIQMGVVPRLGNARGSSSWTMSSLSSLAA